MWITVPNPPGARLSTWNNLLTTSGWAEVNSEVIHGGFSEEFSTFRPVLKLFTAFPQPFNRPSTVHEQSYTHIFFLMISMLFFSSSLEDSSSAILFAP